MSDSIQPKEPPPILLDADVDEHVLGDAGEYGRQLDAWLLKLPPYQPPPQNGTN